MKRVFFLILFCYGSYFLSAQKSMSMYFTVAQSSNNYSFHEIFEIPSQPDELIIFPTSTQLGLSIRKESAPLRYFEFLFSTVFERTRSRRIGSLAAEQLISSYDIERAEIHLRFEYGKMWKVPRHPSIRFGLASSIDPRATMNTYTPRQVDKLEASFNSMGASLNIMPVFSYNINNRFAVNFKMPIEVASLYFIQGSIEETNTSLGQRNISKTYLDALDFYRNYTLSVGYFISHEERKKQN